VIVLYLSHAKKTTEKQLLIPEFHTPSSPWRRDDVTPTELRHHVDLSNKARSPDSTGQILFVFYEIYRIGDSARCRINFARKGILVCVFKSDFYGVFLLRFHKFGVCTLEIADLGYGIKVFLQYLTDVSINRKHLPRKDKR
jgi:hypothetical protein